MGIEKPRLCLIFQGEREEPQSDGVVGDSIHFDGVTLLQK